MSESFETLWTVALQASLSVGLPRQEYWSGLPFPSPYVELFNNKHFHTRDLKVVEIVDAGNTDMKESWIWRADYKLY